MGHRHSHKPTDGAVGAQVSRLSQEPMPAEGRLTVTYVRCGLGEAGMRVALGAGLLTLAMSGCTSAATPQASQEPSVAVGGHVIRAFDLYTHCGIRETRIGGEYYAASPVLDDGSGNPPSGWGNPGQVGTMTVYGDGTARFSAPGGLEANFRVRPGATTWLSTCS